MDYVKLGTAGVDVSRVCMGCMTFGRETDRDESIRIVHAALDAGVNFIDTANIYGRGDSEEITGEALKGRRDEVVLATKVNSPMGRGPNMRGLSRYHIMQQCEASLKRLQTDHIDLYQTHHYDPSVPLEETLSALSDLVRQGKVRYIGASNHAAWQLCEALWVSDVNRLEKYVSIQPRYSLLSREIEFELLPLCRARGVGVIVYSPLCGGILTGKYRPGDAPPEGSRPETNQNFGQFFTEEHLTTVSKLGEWAAGHDMTLPQLAIAWVLANPVVTSAIVGARTVEQLEQSLPGAEKALSAGDLDEIADIIGPVWIPPRTAMWRYK
ncbi:MAG: aldo/keto reductase [Armatimonadota bacterium]|jgi:aryl-alcohol dehydrogenase-like predicted oxidoreductase